MADGETFESADAALSDEKLFREFVGPNSDKFYELYEAQLGKKRKSSLNFVAALFGLPWFFYRKMYLYGVGLLLIPIVLVIIFPQLSTVSMSGFAGAMAVIANTVYVAFARGRIEKLKKQNLPDDELLEKVRKSGGTSIIGAVFGAIIIISAIALPFLVSATATLPACTDGSVSQMAKNLVVDTLKLQGESAQNLRVENLKQLSETVPNEKIYCQGNAVIDDQNNDLFVVIRWQDKSAAEYQVGIAGTKDQILGLEPQKGSK